MTTNVKVKIAFNETEFLMEFGKKVKIHANIKFSIENKSNSKPVQIVFHINKK